MAPLAAPEVKPISTAAPTAEKVNGSLRNRLTRGGPPIQFQVLRTGTTGELRFRGAGC